MYESGDLAAPDRRRLARASVGQPRLRDDGVALDPRAAPLRPSRRSGARRGWSRPHTRARSSGLYVDVVPPLLADDRPLCPSIRLRLAGSDPAEPPPWLEQLPRAARLRDDGHRLQPAALLRAARRRACERGRGSALTVGRNVDPSELGDVPPAIRVERFVPQAQVLASCAAVVSHGGSGTLLGALAAGLPLVLIPQGADQFENAVRCERAGAAVVIRPDEVTGDAVAAAVRLVLSEPAIRRGGPRDRRRDRGDGDSRGGCRSGRGARGRSLGWPRVCTRPHRAARRRAGRGRGCGRRRRGGSHRRGGRRRVDSGGGAEAAPGRSRRSSSRFGIRDDAEAAELRRAAGASRARASGSRRLRSSPATTRSRRSSAPPSRPGRRARTGSSSSALSIPRSSLVQLHVGLSRFWAGTGGALTAWREARDVEPDTPYAVRAGDLHPREGLRAGAARLHRQLRLPDRGRDAGRAAAAARGRPDAARAAALRDRPAGARPPGLGAARVRGRARSWRRTTSTRSSPTPSAATTREIPSAAFSRLGPLSRRFPDAATVRFHLGRAAALAEGRASEATRQLELARKAEPGSKIAAEAKRFLDAVRNAGTS